MWSNIRGNLNFVIYVLFHYNNISCWLNVVECYRVLLITQLLIGILLVPVIGTFLGSVCFL